MSDEVERNVGKISRRSKLPDHSMFLIAFNMYANEIFESIGNMGTKAIRKIAEQFLTSEQAINRLNEFQLYDNSTNIDVNEMVNSFYTLINSELNAILPSTGNSRRKNTWFKPYWNQDLKAKWHKWRNLFHEYKQAVKRKLASVVIRNKKRDYIHSRTVFDRLLKSKKKLYSEKCLKELEDSVKQDPKSFWKAIKKLSRKRQNIELAIEINSEKVTDINLVLEKWSTDFEKLYNDPPENFGNDSRQRLLNWAGCDIRHECLNAEIEISEIKNALKRCKNNKAVGPDLVSYEILRSEHLLVPLQILFNCCLKNGKIPDVWKKAIICPIPKKDSIDTDPNTYRGLSLQSCVYKLFSSVLNLRIVNYLENSELLHNSQNGFRIGRSCEDHVQILVSLIRKAIEKNKEIYACFVDFKKAFDLLDRQILIKKLKILGIDGSILDCISHMYNDTLNSVLLNNKHQGLWFETRSGVKQGDNLSPTLFSVYINELLVDLESLNVGVRSTKGKIIGALAFADDIVLIAENEIDLQKLVSCLKNWASGRAMCVNLSKTKIMVFRKTARNVVTNCWYGPDQIETVSEYKYLGVWLDCTLKFTGHVNKLSIALTHAGGLMFSFFANLGIPYFSTFQRMMKTCLIPMYTYCSSAWGSDVLGNKLDKVIGNLQKRYLGVPKRAHNEAVSGLFGWLNAQNCFKLEKLRYYNKLQRMDVSRLMFDNEVHIDLQSFVQENELYGLNAKLASEVLLDKQHDEWW